AVIVPRLISVGSDLVALLAQAVGAVLHEAASSTRTTPALRPDAVPCGRSCSLGSRVMCTGTIARDRGSPAVPRVVRSLGRTAIRGGGSAGNEATVQATAAAPQNADDPSGDLPHKLHHLGVAQLKPSVELSAYVGTYRDFCGLAAALPPWKGLGRLLGHHGA